MGRRHPAANTRRMTEAFVLLAVAVLSLETAAVEPVRAGVTAASPGITELRSWLARPEGERRADAPSLRVPLRRDEAVESVALLGKDRLDRLAVERKGEVEGKSLMVGEKNLRMAFSRPSPKRVSESRRLLMVLLLVS